MAISADISAGASVAAAASSTIDVAAALGALADVGAQVDGGAQVTAGVAAGASVAASLATAAIDVDIGTQTYRNPDPYLGGYSATPSAAAQTFSTEGKTMTFDFVVEAIPSNYGLITWDGSVLTVS